MAERVSSSGRGGLWPPEQREAARARGRGRAARHPREIPAAGWRDILARVWHILGSDHVTLVASGLSMYALLAVFPGLAAAVSLYGLFASPEDVAQHMAAFSGILPPGVWDIFRSRLAEVAGRGGETLSIGAIGGLLIALWGARAGMASLIAATNIAYKEPERRSFLKQIGLSLAFTIVAIVGFLLTLVLGVGVPLVLEAFGANMLVQDLAAVARWLVLWVMAVAGLALIYRYGPSRDPPRWHWVSWGPAIAATLWLIGSVLFALYVRNFGSYGKTYGALGGVIVLLMWFYITGFMIVLGAEINAEMERQTVRDTTEGPEVPMGQRGAHAADTLGPTREQGAGPGT